jgi:hypothetical protein
MCSALATVFGLSGWRCGGRADAPRLQHALRARARSHRPLLDPVGLQNIDTTLCRAPMVLVNEPAQDIAASDRGLGHHLGVGSRIGRAKLEAPMRPGSVVMLGVRAEDAL